MMELTVSNKERWEATSKKARHANRRNERHEVSYEEMKKFVEDGNFSIKLDRTHQIGLELGLLDPMLHMLAKRKWTLRIAEDGAGDFVTSDHPVVLMPV